LVLAKKRHGGILFNLNIEADKSASI